MPECNIKATAKKDLKARRIIIVEKDQVVTITSISTIGKK